MSTAMTIWSPTSVVPHTTIMDLAAIYKQYDGTNLGQIREVTGPLITQITLNDVLHIYVDSFIFLYARDKDLDLTELYRSLLQCPGVKKEEKSRLHYDSIITVAAQGVFRRTRSFRAAEASSKIWIARDPLPKVHPFSEEGLAELRRIVEFGVAFGLIR